MPKENWNGKEERKVKAEKHVEKMQQFQSYTDFSVKNSVLYDKDCDTKVSSLHLNTKIIVEDMDSVSAIFQYSDKTEQGQSKKICVLNFASYKHPGGGFLGGAMAQEEALCHESNLYSILICFQNSFYQPNQKRLNQGLYNSNLIYSPGVLFIRDKVKNTCDVITAAAPNRGAARRKGVTEEAVNATMENRIDHILYAAYENRAESLILGAYGCGVFKNDASKVASLFQKLLNEKYNGCFSQVIFAVPKGKREQNFEKFREIFKKN